MNSTTSTSFPLFAAVAVLTACVGLTSPASAREAVDHSDTAHVSAAYATPLVALDGRCLAQYLARHQARAAGVVGV